MHRDQEKHQSENRELKDQLPGADNTEAPQLPDVPG